MFEKADNLEIRSSSTSEKSISSRLKEIHIAHLDELSEGWYQHSLVTTQRQTISRILYYDYLYKKIIGVSGCILEFGVQWGGTLSQSITLGGIYEPYNYTRHIYGFDTFEGFVNTHKVKDGEHLSDGDYSLSTGYEEKLEETLSLH